MARSFLPKTAEQVRQEQWQSEQPRGQLASGSPYTFAERLPMMGGGGPGSLLMASNNPSADLLSRYYQAARTVNQGLGGGGAGGYGGGDSGMNLLYQYYNPANWGTNISSQYLAPYTQSAEAAYQKQLSEINSLYSRRGMLGSSEHRAAVQNLDMNRANLMANAQLGAFEKQQAFTGDWLNTTLGYMQNRQNQPFNPGSLWSALSGGKATPTFGFPGVPQQPVTYKAPSMAIRGSPNIGGVGWGAQRGGAF